MILAIALTAALFSQASPTRLQAQQAEIAVTGRVIAADSSPLASQPVMLHRVNAAGGATIAEAITGPDGLFNLVAPPSADTAAVYFVAARHEGELYIGAPFRAAVAPTTQVIQVGVPGTSASVLLNSGQTPAGATGRPSTSRTWMLLLVPLVGVTAVALYMLVPRHRIAADRTLLIQVAELDERMSTATRAQRTGLLNERARLMAQLRGRTLQPRPHAPVPLGARPAERRPH